MSYLCFLPQRNDLPPRSSFQRVHFFIETRFHFATNKTHPSHISLKKAFSPHVIFPSPCLSSRPAAHSSLGRAHITYIQFIRLLILQGKRKKKGEVQRREFPPFGQPTRRISTLPQKHFTCFKTINSIRNFPLLGQQIRVMCSPMWVAFVYTVLDLSSIIGPSLLFFGTAQQHL